MPLKDKIKEIPHKPGVYKFLDAKGKVIYVGKAKDLRSRVAQYFGVHDNRLQIPFLMSKAVDIDYVVVNSELESLFLENTLIKKYRPAYNIDLQDDKNYAFIKIDYSTQIPTIGYERKVEKDERTATYFGPYSSTRKIRQTLDLARRIFSYCANSKVGSRPCFYYYLHRCPGVCVGAMSLSDYEQHLQRIILFLSGKTSEIKKELRTSMANASRRRQFERAAKLRDQMQSLEVLSERQIAMFPQRVNWDFISVFSDQSDASINLFKVREGRLIDKENFIYNVTVGGGENIIQRFAETYYADASDLPKEIYLQISLPNPEIIGHLLRSRAKHKTAVSLPSRGKKLKLIKLGTTNAEEHLKKWQRSQANNLDAAKEALDKLKIALNLASIPRRIEGYDISNIQGTNPVGSMVVAKDGLAAKSEYRKFKINVKQTPDDFAMMEEMLTRRLARISNFQFPISNQVQNSNDKNQKPSWPVPDLIVIDGGKGQLGVAVKILKQKNLTIPAIGLAKRIEEIFVPGKSAPIILSQDDPALKLLQRLRDEAHRFAITFHRGLRSKAAVKSALDEIPGIGPKTKKLLKEKIGTVDQVRRASIDDLAKVIGRQKANQVKKHL